MLRIRSSVSSPSCCMLTRLRSRSLPRAQSPALERVWYCRNKSAKPWLNPQPEDVLLEDMGGQTIWYDEPSMLVGIEKRLGHKVAPLGRDFSTPADWAAARQGEGAEGAVVYGQSRTGGSALNAEAAARQARCVGAVCPVAPVCERALQSFVKIRG